MCKSIGFALYLFSGLFGITNCASSFDQRQTGDLNVQIGLKNIQLIALLNSGNEEYVDYDYAYDYSEMTIKPQNGTTPKPLNITNIHTQINVTSLPTAIVENVTGSSINVNGQTINSTEQTINATDSIVYDTAVPEEGTGNNNTVSDNYPTYGNVTEVASAMTASTTVLPSTVSVNNCRRGFVQNNQGKCEYKVHGTSNALRRIVKLAQKIKIGRGYKET